MKLWKKILVSASLMLVMAPVGGASANETKTITSVLSKSGNYLKVQLI